MAHRFRAYRVSVSIRVSLAFALIVFAPRPAAAQVSADYAVGVSATVQTAPPAIALAWPSYPSATAYAVARKAFADTSWPAPLATLPGTATGWMDTSAAPGVRYEYRVMRSAAVTGWGYLASGIEIPLVEDRGKMILVVDSTMATPLAPELATLTRDLAGDGWTVLRHDVARDAAVTAVKAQIKSDYDADPANVYAVFLFGHVPVPYAGNLAPDGHPDHVGAWPADIYYADMHGTWTDTANFGGTGRQGNVPGDGKWDQTYAPGGADLGVGRVDLSNLPAFAPKTETDLLRQYLNKDHAFRTKVWSLPARGLIDDNFGAFGGEAFASTGWRTFAAFFGAANVFALDWFGTLATDGYLWAYGCGGGWFQGAGGVGATSDFATIDTKVAFTFLFGSYFGDWDVTDDFLRAPLATPTYGLTSAWAGRPAWYVHHMAMGETIGYGARVTQNNSSVYFYGYGPEVHVALMGDPTLRMHTVAPASNLAAAPGGTSVALTWTGSADAVAGYNVYRAPGPAGPFTRRNSGLVTGTSFTDSGVGAGSWSYQVRSVRLETSASGSYWNSGTGAAVSATIGGSTGTVFNTLAPCRLIDTRLANGPLGGPALAASQARTFTASGTCGIPATAKALSLNVTVTAPTATGFLVLYPGDYSASPGTSNLNFRGGQTRANNAVVGLASDATGRFIVQNVSPGTAHVIVDVSGFFQ